MYKNPLRKYDPTLPEIVPDDYTGAITKSFYLPKDQGILFYYLMTMIGSSGGDLNLNIVIKEAIDLWIEKNKGAYLKILADRNQTNASHHLKEAMQKGSVDGREDYEQFKQYEKALGEIQKRLSTIRSSEFEGAVPQDLLKDVMKAFHKHVRNSNLLTAVEDAKGEFEWEVDAFDETDFNQYQHFSESNYQQIDELTKMFRKDKLTDK